jgi:hypothetical protein
MLWISNLSLSIKCHTMATTPGGVPKRELKGYSPSIWVNILKAFPSQDMVLFIFYFVLMIRSNEVFSLFTFGFWYASLKSTKLKHVLKSLEPVLSARQKTSINHAIKLSPICLVPQCFCFVALTCSYISLQVQYGAMQLLFERLITAIQCASIARFLFFCIAP